MTIGNPEKTKARTQAFSLVELSIVLVIIGLIAGGVTVGQDLIRAAEMKSVMKQVEEYRVSYQLFLDKYFALAGDMKNATDYWGIAAGDGYNSTCTAFASTGTATCNGNGDNLIRDAGSANSERWRFWQHLANAGMVAGNYNGTAGPGGHADGVIGTNLPAGPISNSSFMIFGSSGWFFGVKNNILVFGAELEAGNSYNFHEILTPQEAWEMDKKFDDSMPGKGSIITQSTSYTGYAGSCVDSADPATAAYRLSQNTVLCNLAFVFE